MLNHINRQFRPAMKTCEDPYSLSQTRKLWWSDGVGTLSRTRTFMLDAPSLGDCITLAGEEVRRGQLHAHKQQGTWDLRKVYPSCKINVAHVCVQHAKFGYGEFHPSLKPLKNVESQAPNCHVGSHDSRVLSPWSKSGCLGSWSKGDVSLEPRAFLSLAKFQA